MEARKRCKILYERPIVVRLRALFNTESVSGENAGALSGTVDIAVTNQTTGRHHSIRQPVAFGFSSDKDPNSIDHNVELEALALGYVGPSLISLKRPPELATARPFPN